MEDKRVIQSYVVNRQGKEFFVSTIERDSSSPYGPERYLETFVWATNGKREKVGGILWEDDNHFAVCRRILETGSPEEPAHD